MATTNTNTQRPVDHFFLRAGFGPKDPAEAHFELLGIKSIMHVNAKGEITIYKALKDGAPSAKPIARGHFRKSASRATNAPDIVGIVRTAKGTEFQLVGWLKTEDFDRYYSVQYNEYQRQGTLPFAD